LMGLNRLIRLIRLDEFKGIERDKLEI